MGGTWWGLQKEAEEQLNQSSLKVTQEHGFRQGSGREITPILSLFQTFNSRPEDFGACSVMKVRTEDGLHDSVSASGKLQPKVTFRTAQQNTEVQNRGDRRIQTPGVILQLQFHSNNLDKSDLDGAKSRK